MKKLITSLAVLALSITFAGAADEKKDAAAAPGEKKHHNPEEQFKKLDTNGDGSLSLEEFKAGKKDPAKAEEIFKKKDKNNDGKLTLEEFSAHEGKKAEVKPEATAGSPKPADAGAPKIEEKK